MFFDDSPSDVDEVIEFDGIKVIVDPLSYQYVEDVTMDYAVDTMSEGFKFENPNVKGSCGCGNSYSF
jgi:iron-sulfur cluster assembly accessory protein